MSETYKIIPIYIQQTVLAFEEFANPFGARLRKDNKWVIRAGLVPWQDLSASCSEVNAGPGRPQLPLRIALGALMVKELLGCTDRETVDAIVENPYIQFFLGLPSFSVEEPFDHSSMTYFRKRIGDDMIRKANVHMIETQLKAIGEEKSRMRKVRIEPDGVQSDALVQEDAVTVKNAIHKVDNASGIAENASANKGTLIIDATCAPEDMRFPTDLGLLNDVRTFTEAMVTYLWNRSSLKKGVGEKKPRTYRIEARKNFLSGARCRKIKKNALRKVLRKQIGYCRRNLKRVDDLLGRMDAGFELSDKHAERLATARRIVGQQGNLYVIKGQKGRERESVSGRIVSFFKPHVRAIVRGKASAPTEFGAKLSVSVSAGFAYLDRLSWDPYHEGADLKTHAEGFEKRTGRFPKEILADKAYHSRENREYCALHGIRLGAPLVGRPTEDKELRKEQARQLRRDEIGRIAVEGKFGVAKRRFSLDKVMARLRESSECVISLVFMVMNLEKLASLLFCALEWLAAMACFWREYFARPSSPEHFPLEAWA